MKLLSRIRFLFFGLMVVTISSFAQPVNNPYRSRYNGPQHWTDSLNWGNIYDVTANNVLPTNDSVSNTINLRALIGTVSAAGGGVIYFPAGLYNFSDSLELKSGVILRGEDPLVTNARDSTYRPQSRLNFPRYISDTTANNGNGIDNSSAFKWITCEANASNFGVVNLDINRAKIFFMPKSYFHNPNPKGAGGWPGGTVLNGVNGTMLPSDIPQNVLVFGIRENNAALPDPATPKMVAGFDQKAWQRYSWRFASFIDLHVAKNGVVANNRLGDETTDNFNQPGYKGNNCALNLPINDGGKGSEFNYTDHYGIQVNRFKITGSVGNGLNSKFGLFPYILYAYPDDEPTLYAPGNEILDNWVFKTMRVAIIAAGSRLKIKRNECHDKKGKVVYILPGGTGCSVHGSTTYENRGVDFAGWGLEVDSNEFEIYQHYSPKTGANTPDGEFMLLQECCGGVPVNDYTIRNNKGNSYIGFYFIRDINHVTITGNTADVNIRSNFPAGIFLGADVYDATQPGNFVGYTLSNTLVEGNTTSNGIFAIGSKGGYNVVLKDNVCTNPYPITASCYVDVQSSNTGFSTIKYKVAHGMAGVDTTGPCATDPASFPAIKMVAPSTDSIIDFDSLLLRNTLTIKIVSKGGNLGQELGNIYINGAKVAAALSFDPSDSSASYLWTIPQTPNQVYNLSSEIWDTVTRVHSFSQPLNIQVRKLLGVASGSTFSELKVFPNPVHQGSFAIQRTSQEPAIITITDITGHELGTRVMAPGQLNTEITNMNLPAGFYLMNYTSGGFKRQYKLIFK
jgi:hypothetical protein